MLLLASGRLLVTNFRGRRIPATGGVVLVMCVLVCAAILALLALLAAPSPREGVGAQGPGLSIHLGMLLIAVGFFALGLIDDMSDGTSARGIRGHLGALREGSVTGGMVKAAGGLALAFFVSALWELRLGPALLGALTIAASANLFNLLDLRPGRACKFYFLAWLPLAYVCGRRAPLYLPLSAGLTGAAAGWLPGDLHEEGILGDSGSNMLGGIIGAGIVLGSGPAAELAILICLLALTAASEKLSFSTAINKIPPLRWFDGLGRAP